LKWPKYPWSKKIKKGLQGAFSYFHNGFFFCYCQVDWGAIWYLHNIKKYKKKWLACVGGICALWALRVAPSSNQKPPFNMSLQALLCLCFLGGDCGRCWHSLSLATLSFPPLFSFLLSKFTLTMQNFKVVL
jgi:hypothetical protein